MEGIRDFFATLFVIPMFVLSICAIILLAVFSTMTIPAIGLFETIHYEPYNIPGKFLEKILYSTSY